MSGLATVADVLIYPIAVAGALLLVPITRGSFRQLAQLRVHHLWALFLGAALQIALEFDVVPTQYRNTIGFGILMASYALLLAFCFGNFGTRGFGVIALGVVMNTVVIGVNRGMPYVVQPGERRVVTVKHRPETAADRLTVLGDTIPLPDPLAITISLGDIVVALGLVDLVFWGSRKPKHGTDATPETPTIDLTAPDFLEGAPESEQPVEAEFWNR
ncbi:MAG: DUF5317 family protein [Acidimicrobiia bacterium]